MIGLTLVVSACGARYTSQEQDAGPDIAPSNQGGCQAANSTIPESGLTGCDAAALATSAALAESPGVTGLCGQNNTTAVFVVTTDSLSGFTVHASSDLINKPAAQDPSYVYLRHGVDAVRLPGPVIEASSLADLAAISSAHNDSAQLCVWGSSYECGIRFILNERLHYDIKIVDFENEVSLGWVELIPVGYTTLLATFVLLGVGGGVARDIQITPVLDGVAGCPTAPISLEVR